MPDDDFSEDDPSVPWNLRDVYEMGDDETKRRLEDEAQERSDNLRSRIDQNQLRVVRTGGHMVRVRDGRRCVRSSGLHLSHGTEIRLLELQPFP